MLLQHPYIIFLACFVLLLAALVFIWQVKARRGGLGLAAFIRQRSRYRLTQRYNQQLRPGIQREYPDHYVAALLPVRVVGGDTVEYYCTWTNFVPAILPLSYLAGVVLMEVNRDSGMVRVAGVVKPDDVSALVSTDLRKPVNNHQGLWVIEQVEPAVRQALVDRGKDRPLPEALETLGLLRVGQKSQR